MSFLWKTAMRSSDDRDARAVDRLSGQAALKVLDGGRVQLLVMPDYHTFSASAVISTDDAWLLVHELTAALEVTGAGDA